MDTIMDQGIVLAMQPFRDSDWIIRWICHETGRMDTLARGARKTGSSFHGRVGLYNRCRISFLRSSRSELHTLKECSLIEHPSHLEKSILGLQAMAAATGMIESLTEKNTPLPEIFESLRTLLTALKNPSPVSIEGFYTRFEVELLKLGGMAPASLPSPLISRISAPEQPSDTDNFTERLGRFTSSLMARQQLTIPESRSRFLRHLSAATKSQPQHHQKNEENEPDRSGETSSRDIGETGGNQ